MPCATTSCAPTTSPTPSTPRSRPPARLYGQAEEIYAEAATFISRESSDGTLLSGEVLAQWQEFVGTGEMVRSVEERVTRIRERLVEGVTGKRTRSTEVAEAVEAGLAVARHRVCGVRGRGGQPGLGC